MQGGTQPGRQIAPRMEHGDRNQNVGLVFPSRLGEGLALAATLLLQAFPAANHGQEHLGSMESAASRDALH